MKALYDLREMLCSELDGYARKRDMSAGDLEAVHKLTDTIKNIDKIIMLNESEEGHSEAGDWHAEGSYDNSYCEGDSYARSRRGMHYVRGHYSHARDGRGYSRGGNEGIIRHLEEMASNAGSDREREAIRRCIEEIKR